MWRKAIVVKSGDGKDLTDDEGRDFGVGGRCIEGTAIEFVNDKFDLEEPGEGASFGINGQVGVQLVEVECGRFDTKECLDFLVVIIADAKLVGDSTQILVLPRGNFLFVQLVEGLLVDLESDADVQQGVIR